MGQRGAMLPLAQHGAQHTAQQRSESNSNAGEHSMQQHGGMLTPAQHAAQQPSDSILGASEHDMPEGLNSRQGPAQHDRAQRPASNASTAQHAKQRDQGANADVAPHGMQQQMHAAVPTARSNLLHRMPLHSKQAQQDMQQSSPGPYTDTMPQLKLVSRSASLTRPVSQPHAQSVVVPHMAAHVATHVPSKQPMVKRHAFGGRPIWVRQRNEPGNEQQLPQGMTLETGRSRLSYAHVHMLLVYQLETSVKLFGMVYHTTTPGFTYNQKQMNSSRSMSTQV